MKTLLVTIARLAIAKMLSMNPRVPASRLLWIAAFAAVGAWLGRSGFGTYLLPGDHRYLYGFWHGPMEFVGAWAAVAVYMAHAVVVGRIGKMTAQPVLIFLLAPSLYVTLVALAFVFFTLWTVPFWVALQFGSLALVFVRPELARLASRLGPVERVYIARPVGRAS